MLKNLKKLFTGYFHYLIVLTIAIIGWRFDYHFTFPSIKPKDEFVWDFLIELSGATIGAASAVYLFFRQLSINKKNEDDRKVQHERDKLIYFTATIKNIIDLVESQVNHINNFVEEVSKNYIDIPLLSTHPFNELDRLIIKDNHEEYYFAFIRQNEHINQAAKKFDSIYAAVYHFDGTLKQLMVFLERKRTKDFERKLAFKDNLMQSQELLAKLLKHLKTTNQVHLYQTLNRLLNEQHERLERDNRNLQLMKTQFLDPVIKISVNYLDNELFKILAQEVKKGRMKFTEIVEHNRVMASEIKEYSENLTNTLQRIKSDLELLKDYKNDSYDNKKNES